MKPVGLGCSGQGYINCLNAARTSDIPTLERDDFRYTTSHLPRLVTVGEDAVSRVSTVVQQCLEDNSPYADPRLHSAKLQVGKATQRLGIVFSRIINMYLFSGS